MIYGSVCSGIEAATVAWHPLGWKPAFFSEIESFPRAVLAHHYPETPLHGDFTTIGADQYGPIDLLVGGTPCQSFSIAGLRGGLDDERGNLALEFLRLAQRTRAKWLVWENVPGVLSSNGGRDFGAILGGMVELGYGFAYRVLDAQFFGVPQRRRRVFVVGHLGSWQRAAAVLFERHSLSGHSAPRREAGQGVAGTLESRASGGGGGPGAGTDGAAAGYLQPGGGGDCSSLPQVAMCLTRGSMQRMDAETETLIPTHGGGFDDDLVCFEANMSLQEPTVGGPHPTLTRRTHAAVAYPRDTQNMTEGHNSGGKGFGEAGDPSFTLTKGHSHGVATASAVRRLTPVECERLQGFPDNYTAIPWRKKAADECPDGPRYKALGNSMAVPVMRWIGERIALVDAIKAERRAA